MTFSAASSGGIVVRAMAPTEAEERMRGLVALLIDSVEGGASIGFHYPLAPEKAETFWQRWIDEVAAGQRRLLIAEHGETIVGCVMLALPAFENGFNRADVQKLLVLRSYRRRGIARRLMIGLETLGRDLGRRLLVLDSSTDTDGNHFYSATGWTHVGDVPDYASLPDGRLHPTSLFYKQLEALQEGATA
ncbi:MAG: GNAT family N-acetyltransferase [Alphaproteobacteria bacterium]